MQSFFVYANIICSILQKLPIIFKSIIGLISLYEKMNYVLDLKQNSNSTNLNQIYELIISIESITFSTFSILGGLFL
jgi:hypothetical protein